jgi:trans-aconitate methyltransferase
MNGSLSEFDDFDLCDQLTELFANTKVLDLGCGMGHYGECLQKVQKNISWSGYDGSEGISEAVSFKINRLTACSQ